MRTLFVGLRSPTTTSGLMVDSSLQMFKRGEAERLTELLGCCLGHSGVAKSKSTFLCVFPMWIFKPFSDLKLFSHWSHLKTFFTVSSLEARVTSMKSAVHERGSDFFFFRNSALRLAFLLIAEGLFLFTALAAGGKQLSLVSKENAKVEPMVTEKVKDLFWLASAWQKSMHWEAKEESTEAIFLFI